jgi:hypothetical protein
MLMCSVLRAFRKQARMLAGYCTFAWPMRGLLALVLWFCANVSEDSLVRDVRGIRGLEVLFVGYIDSKALQIAPTGSEVAFAPSLALIFTFLALSMFLLLI